VKETQGNIQPRFFLKLTGHAVCIENKTLAAADSFVINKT